MPADCKSIRQQGARDEREHDSGGSPPLPPDPQVGGDPEDGLVSDEARKEDKAAKSALARDLKDIAAETPMREPRKTFNEDERVTSIADGQWGTVTAVYPDDFEDDLEVRLDDGTFTCSNHRHFINGEVNIDKRSEHDLGSPVGFQASAVRASLVQTSRAVLSPNDCEPPKLNVRIAARRVWGSGWFQERNPGSWMLATGTCKHENIVVGRRGSDLVDRCSDCGAERKTGEEPTDQGNAAGVQEQVAALANLVGRLAFLVQNQIGEGHSTEIQREADAIRDWLIFDRRRA